jgi:hypothetical protein
LDRALGHIADLGEATDEAGHGLGDHVPAGLSGAPARPGVLPLPLPVADADDPEDVHLADEVEGRVNLVGCPAREGAVSMYLAEPLALLLERAIEGDAEAADLG